MSRMIAMRPGNKEQRALLLLIVEDNLVDASQWRDGEPERIEGCLLYNRTEGVIRMVPTLGPLRR